jgi:hypothetical protein
LAEDTALLATTMLSPGQIEVLHEGQRLAEPRVVTVRFVSRGRRDIGSTDFDGGRPLVINLGVPIVKRLTIETVPNMPEAAFAVDGTRLLVGPCVVRKRQVMTITFLVDGGPVKLSHQDDPLDVAVREGTADADQDRQRKYLRTSIVVALATAGLATVVLKAGELGKTTTLADFLYGIATGIGTGVLATVLRILHPTKVAKRWVRL